MSDAAKPVLRVTNTTFSSPNNTVSLRPIEKETPSSTESRTSGGTAQFLPEERKRATFNVTKMTNYLDGGPKVTAKRRWILSPTKDTDMRHKYFMARGEQLESHLHHFLKVHDEFMTSYIPTREEVGWMQENSMNSGAMMNHWGLFIPTLLIQASDEQKAEWLSRAMMMQVVGCYAQTEIGHGSNVRALRTTATYDPASETFIMDTPTLQASKWWPGTLGKVATHAMVYAQLIVDGTEHGVHSFVVQIRDENHRPLPGIEVGEMGPKLGDGANDTGFLRMHTVRIPRTNMLAKFQRVTKEGKFVKTTASADGGGDKVQYATMMFTRGAMVKQTGGMLARAVTIAARYSAVRRQGYANPSSTVSYKDPELPILDHRMQLYRVAKQLSTAYALKFTGKWMVELFSKLEGGHVAGGIANASVLSEVAATSAGLKGVTIVMACDGIEDCRKACGGNGYLLSSGVAALGADYVWQSTAEGDYIVMTLQSARFVIKHINEARAGKAPLSGPLAYLTPLTKPGVTAQGLADLEPRFASEADARDLSKLQALAEYRALQDFFFADARYEEELKRFKAEHTAGSQPESWPADRAWAAVGVDMVHAVNANCLAFLISTFRSGVENCEEAACKAALGRLCGLFAVSMLTERSPGAAPTAAAAGESAGSGFPGLARRAREQLLSELRPDMVALVDAFDIPDRVLNSTIGRSDGNVYEALFESARASNLNRTDPFEGYERVLRPRLDREFLEEGRRAAEKWASGALASKL